jgi:hypothetical protein
MARLLPRVGPAVLAAVILPVLLAPRGQMPVIETLPSLVAALAAWVLWRRTTRHPFAVDHFHLILLANKAVTAVRQRVTRDLLDRRGRKSDPTWANRRLLLRGREHLSERAPARMWNGCIDHDPTGQILSAWIAKEELRALCATATRGGHPSEIRDRLHAFYQWCADADIPSSPLPRRRSRPGGPPSRCSSRPG